MDLVQIPVDWIYPSWCGFMTEFFNVFINISKEDILALSESKSWVSINLS